MIVGPKPKKKHIRSRFDLGKYKWTGTIRDYYGQEVPDIDGVKAVYPEKRTDRYGDYVVLVSAQW